MTQVNDFKGDDTVITGFAYDYDAAGNRTAVLESGGDRTTWTYDTTNRLTREQRSGTAAYDTTYTYDGLGNRLVKDTSGAKTTSTYDLANQLKTSQDVNGTTTYTYDEAGNLNLVESPTGDRTTTTWYVGRRRTDRTLAHEIGHVLTRIGGHPEVAPNLMSEGAAGEVLTIKQCDLARVRAAAIEQRATRPTPAP
jgi:YD repeat-containing protein